MKTSGIGKFAPGMAHLLMAVALSLLLFSCYDATPDCTEHYPDRNSMQDNDLKQWIPSTASNINLCMFLEWQICVAYIVYDYPPDVEEERMAEEIISLLKKSDTEDEQGRYRWESPLSTRKVAHNSELRLNDYARKVDTPFWDLGNSRRGVELELMRSFDHVGIFVDSERHKVYMYFSH